MRKSIVLGIAIIVILSFAFAASFYYVSRVNNDSHKMPGPYLDLFIRGYNGSTVSPIKDNLTADVSVWAPSEYGNGEIMNLYDSSVKWNQNISLGSNSNFTASMDAWKSYIRGKYGGEPTMSLIVTYTKVNSSYLDIFEYYTNIPFNPSSQYMNSQVFKYNITMDITHPIASIPIQYNSSTPSPSIPSPGVIGTGSCPPGNTQIVWGTPHKETGWYPLYLINSTEEPVNEELVLSWTSASFSAKLEFGGVTSTNGNFLSSDNGYITPNLDFNSKSYQMAGNPGMYDVIFLPNTTMTWTFGKEYFYEPDGSYCELVGKANVSLLKVEYSNSSGIITEGLPYSTKQAANGSTYGNGTFEEEWARAAAYAFSNEYTQLGKQFNISAGRNITIDDFDLQASSNFNAITQTIKDERAVALGFSSAGLIISIMAAAASFFPGGAAPSILAEISLFASIGGFTDSLVNLATTLTLVVNVTGNLQTMGATNQIYNGLNPVSPIEVSMYDTGGNTYFNTDNGTVSYEARTPYVLVTP